MAFEATYRHDGRAIDYTPAADVAAGTVVVVNGIVGIPPTDIPANTQGALQIMGVHRFSKGADAFAVGDRAHWDDANNQATLAATGPVLGKVTAVALTGDGGVDVLLNADAGGSGLPFRAVAPSTAISNTVTETAFDQAYTIPANTLRAGDVLRVRAQAVATATNSTDTLDFQLRLGTTDVLATGPVDVANGDIGYIECDIVIRTVGANGTIVAAGVVALGVPGTVTAKPKFLPSTVVDTTVAISVNCSATWSVANAGNSVRLDILNVQLIRRG